MSGNVGLAIKAAMERAQQHMDMCPRKLTVRLSTHWGDDRAHLTIAAGIAMKSAEEQDIERPIRQVAWEDLDKRAHELVGLVDEVVLEIEKAFNIKPAKQ